MSSKCELWNMSIIMKIKKVLIPYLVTKSKRAKQNHWSLNYFKPRNTNTVQNDTRYTCKIAESRMFSKDQLRRMWHADRAAYSSGHVVPYHFGSSLIPCSLFPLNSGHTSSLTFYYTKENIHILTHIKLVFFLFIIEYQ